MQIKTLRGVVHGKAIELTEETGLTEGQEVTVEIRPIIADVSARNTPPPWWLDHLDVDPTVAGETHHQGNPPPGGSTGCSSPRRVVGRGVAASAPGTDTGGYGCRAGVLQSSAVLAVLLEHGPRMPRNWTSIWNGTTSMRKVSRQELEP